MLLHALLPLDASSLRRGTLSVACRLLDPRRYRLTLLHVAAPSSSSLFTGSVLIDAWMRRLDTDEASPARTARVRREFEHQLAADVESLATAGFAVALAVGFGRPADEIVAIATQERADLVLMSSPGHDASGRVPLGSLIEEVVRRGPAPVMLVRPAGWRKPTTLPLPSVATIGAVAAIGWR